MSVTHVNRKGQTWYLHLGSTKTGKPKYYFSKKRDGQLCDAVPEGFEVYENPHAQVFCRRARPKLISEFEVEMVKRCLRSAGKDDMSLVDVQGAEIVIYTGNQRAIADGLSAVLSSVGASRLLAPGGELDPDRHASYHQELKFSLIDEDRLFAASRWCYRGSVDNWFPLSAGPAPLRDLAETYIPHLGEKSFFELF